MMQGLDVFPGLVSPVNPGLVLVGAVAALFFSGLVPIPVGYARGKVKWLMWCATGMHFHTVYWHSETDGRLERAGFQSVHPADVGGEDGE